MPARGEPRRERDDAVVVLLDVVERAARATSDSQSARRVGPWLPARRSLAVVCNQPSIGSKPGRQRIGKREVSALAADRDRDRDAHEIARR